MDNPLTGNSLRLSLLVLASLALHVLVLMHWPSRPPAAPGAKSGIQIALIDTTGAAPALHQSNTPPKHTQPAALENPVRRPAADSRNAGTDQPMPEAREETAPRLPTTVAGAAPFRSPEIPDAGSPVHAASAHRSVPIPIAEQQPRPAAVPATVDEAGKPESSAPEKLRNPGGAPAAGRGATPPQIAAPTGSPVQASPAPTVGAAATGAPAAGSVVQADIARALRAAMLPHFRYPFLARRRGWEGVVRLGMRVEDDGRLQNIHVAQTSGHRTLDVAALRTMHKVDSVPGVALALRGNWVDVVLPVEYRLQDR